MKPALILIGLGFFGMLLCVLVEMVAHQVRQRRWRRMAAEAVAKDQRASARTKEVPRA